MTTGMLELSCEWKSVHPYNFGCIYRLDLNMMGSFTGFIGVIRGIAHGKMRKRVRSPHDNTVPELCQHACW